MSGVDLMELSKGAITAAKKTALKGQLTMNDLNFVKLMDVIRKIDWSHDSDGKPVVRPMEVTAHSSATLLQERGVKPKTACDHCITLDLPRPLEPVFRGCQVLRKEASVYELHAPMGRGKEDGWLGNMQYSVAQQTLRIDLTAYLVTLGLRDDETGSNVDINIDEEPPRNLRTGKGRGTQTIALEEEEGTSNRVTRSKNPDATTSSQMPPPATGKRARANPTGNARQPSQKLATTGRAQETPRDHNSPEVVSDAQSPMETPGITTVTNNDNAPDDQDLPGITGEEASSAEEALDITSITGHTTDSELTDLNEEVEYYNKLIAEDNQGPTRQDAPIGRHTVSRLDLRISPQGVLDYCNANRLDANDSSHRVETRQALRCTKLVRYRTVASESRHEIASILGDRPYAYIIDTGPTAKDTDIQAAINTELKTRNGGNIPAYEIRENIRTKKGRSTGIFV
ncbi:uncharacterized protein CDV56_100401, partial [Aspergillus thermomutatus]